MLLLLLVLIIVIKGHKSPPLEKFENYPNDIASSNNQPKLVDQDVANLYIEGVSWPSLDSGERIVLSMTGDLSSASLPLISTMEAIGATVSISPDNEAITIKKDSEVIDIVIGDIILHNGAELYSPYLPTRISDIINEKAPQRIMDRFIQKSRNHH
ncbi:MAG: hypothetical protein Q4B48_01000 [Syntrophomonadaceae bacterium]|nr:hypothetical protein [Syntrophomonadaceae bacterium]